MVRQSTIISLRGQRSVVEVILLFQQEWWLRPYSVSDIRATKHKKIVPLVSSNSTIMRSVFLKKIIKRVR